MTSITIALACVTIGLAPTALAEDDNQFFQDPSGNIKCELTTNYKGVPYANCTVAVAAYRTRADNCDTPASVHPQFSLTQGSEPTSSCVVGSLEYRWPTLDFGQTRSVGTVTCDNEPTGVTCTDTGTRRFFRASGHSYELG
jgi:hypothetical protein